MPMDGVAIVLAALSTISFLAFWIVFSKLLPPTDIWIIEFMREDDYYCFLVPLSIVPVSLLANYLRWISLSLALRS